MKGLKQRQEAFASRVAENVKIEVMDSITELLPERQDPWIALREGGKGIYLSVMESDEYDQYISWEDFEKSILGHDDEPDPELLREYLPKFEQLVEKIRKECAA